MRAFATATLLISPAITVSSLSLVFSVSSPLQVVLSPHLHFLQLAATCSQSNGETKLPSWYISSTDPVGTKFTDPELVYIPTVAAFQKLGETDLGTKPATQECRANEKCYYSGSPICLDEYVLFFLVSLLLLLLLLLVVHPFSVIIMPVTIFTNLLPPLCCCKIVPPKPCGSVQS